jgi:hypothetical protein
VIHAGTMWLRVHVAEEKQGLRLKMTPRSASTILGRLTKGAENQMLPSPRRRPRSGAVSMRRRHLASALRAMLFAAAGRDSFPCKGLSSPRRER